MTHLVQYPAEYQSQPTKVPAEICVPGWLYGERFVTKVEFEDPLTCTIFKREVQDLVTAQLICKKADYERFCCKLYALTHFLQGSIAWRKAVVNLDYNKEAVHRIADRMAHTILKTAKIHLVDKEGQDIKDKFIAQPHLLVSAIEKGNVNWTRI